MGNNCAYFNYVLLILAEPNNKPSKVKFLDNIKNRGYISEKQIEILKPMIKKYKERKLAEIGF